MLIGFGWCEVSFFCVKDSWGHSWLRASSKLRRSRASLSFVKCICPILSCKSSDENAKIIGARETNFSLWLDFRRASSRSLRPLR